MSEFDFNKIRRLDGTLLLVLRELLRRRRASEVALRLGLSASAVSHALARLRDLFEDPLFIRRPHGLEPTRRALELGPRIEALLDLTAAALATEGGFDPARSDRWFTFSSSEYVTVLIGARLLESLRTTAPGVAFTVHTLVQDRALDAVRRGEIDLAMGRFGPPGPGLTVETLFEDTYCVVARKGHPRVKGAVSWEDYAAIGHVFSGAWGEGSADESVPPRQEIATLAVVPRWLTALAMAAESDALVTCPRRLAERQAPLLGLQVVDHPDPQTPFAVQVARREGPDPAVAWMMDQLRAAAVG
jgi:DNA-binding transcriptional LysR family regulator